MSAATGLDIRLPIGGLFTALGLLLGGYGLATGEAPSHSPVLPLNIDLWWGAVMLVFGILLLVGGTRAARKAGMHPAVESEAGEETEEREHELGLEQ
jgi:TRAP-type C4-dicarboxylate transport system permease small subunit